MYQFHESRTGYVWTFIMYTGATIKYGSKFVDEPTTSRIVLQLAEPILDDHEMEGQITVSTVNNNHIVPVQKRRGRP
jgi:hypothetical protein